MHAKSIRHFRKGGYDTNNTIIILIICIPVLKWTFIFQQDGKKGYDTINM